ncbi:MAG: hypothetical protein SGARI_000618 [Bacillariaceae sp.]
MTSSSGGGDGEVAASLPFSPRSAVAPSTPKAAVVSPESGKKANIKRQQKQLETAQKALEYVLDTSKEQQLLPQDQGDSVVELNDVLKGINEQKHTPKGQHGVQALVSPATTSSMTFFSSEVSEGGSTRHTADESHSSDPVAALRREILQQPSLEHDAGGKPLASTLSSKHSVDEYHAFLRQQSREQHEEIESMLRTLDSKVQETSQTTAEKLKALHEKLAAAQLKQAKNLQQQEQRLKSSPRSTTIEIKNARTARQQSKKQHDEINTMLTLLHAKVHETSAHTSSQIQDLYDTLQQAKLQQETVHNKAMGDLAQQMKDQERAQKKHLDAVVLQYLQQQEGLEEQLKESQELLQEAESDLETLKQRYQQLEATTVTPDDAQQVLEKVQAMEDAMQKSGILANVKNKRSSAAVAKAQEISKVNQEVIAVLSRMADRKTHQEPRTDGLVEHLKAARKKQADTAEELDFLNLQKQLLVEDTTKVTAQEYEEMTAAEKQKYQDELASILETEGQRLKEMESLEVELTHLAFLAVQIEECEKEFRQQQALYQESLKELKTQNETSTTKLRHLQSDVQQTVGQQASKVGEGDKKGPPNLSAADLRIRELERALAERDADLDNVKAELQLCQERVKLLESAISSQ